MPAPRAKKQHSDVTGRPSAAERIEALEREVQALRRSEALLRDFLESSDTGLHWVGPDGTILWANQAELDMMGYARHEYIGRNIAEFHADDDKIRDILQRLSAGERLRDYTARLRRRDGSIREVVINSSVLFENGEFVHTRCFTRDVTELRQQELASRLLTAIVDSSDDAIISKDLTGRITSWNRGAERIFGYTAEEAVGQSILMLIPPDRQGEEPQILARLQRGERVDHFETIRRRKDGTLLNISLTISPVRDASGKIVGASKIARDITDRKRTEEKLRTGEERFRTLADNISQFAWMAEKDGSIFWFNQRWYDYTGATFTDMAGWGWQSVLHPEHAGRVTQHLRECLVSGAAWEDTFPIRSKEGDYRWFLSRALPIRDASDRIVRWFGTNTDITDRLETERQLRTANADLEQFAFSASHDLQEPLRMIRIYSDLLNRRYASTLQEEAKEFLGYVTRAATRMDLLVRDLLTYTRVSEADVEAEEGDANEALATTLAALEGAIQESGAVITNDPLPKLSVRQTHLRQLLQNVVENAIKYRSPERPLEVHVSAERDDRSWKFIVRDNGIGIEPEYRQQVFGLFKRLHGGDRYAGTGIGLAICQRIVERYKGRIWAEGEPGGGSRFCFLLPA